MVNIKMKQDIIERLEEDIDRIFDYYFTEFDITDGDISPLEVFSIMDCEEKLADIISEHIVSKVEKH